MALAAAVQSPRTDPSPINFNRSSNDNQSNTSTSQEDRIQENKQQQQPSTSMEAIPVLSLEESRQGSFDKALKVRVSNSTMPSTVVEAGAGEGAGDPTGGVDVQNGRDSPPSLRVRFGDSGNALLHQSQPSFNHDPNTNTTSSTLPAPILALKTKHASPTPSPDKLKVTSPPKTTNTASNAATTTTLARPAASVFERLSKTETIAFMNQKFFNQPPKIQERTMKRSTSAPPSLRSKNTVPKQQQQQQQQNLPPTSPSKGKGQNSPEKNNKPNLTDKIVNLASTSFELFERLAEKHTKLSKSRRRVRTSTTPNRHTNHNDPTSKTSKKTTNPNDPRATRRNLIGRRHSLGRTHSFDRWKSHKYDVPAVNNKTSKKTRPTTNAKTKRVQKVLDDAFDVESTGPPMMIEFSSQTKILCSNKFEPEAGFEELDLFELGLNSPLSEYEAGAMSAKEFASEIMNALLWRDLPSNIKWDVRCPLERELAMPIGEIGYSFMIEAAGNSILEANELSDDEVEELYTASATGNVTFLPDREIQVENYSCVYTYDDLEL